MKKQLAAQDANIPQHGLSSTCKLASTYQPPWAKRQTPYWG
jgi:hypothetical protein